MVTHDDSHGRPPIKTMKSLRNWKGVGTGATGVFGDWNQCNNRWWVLPGRKIRTGNEVTRSPDKPGGITDYVISDI